MAGWILNQWTTREGLFLLFLFSLPIIIIFKIFIYLASCGMWDFVSRPGMEPMPPALEAWNLNHWTTREIPELVKSF